VYARLRTVGSNADASSVALEKEFPEDGDARMCRAIYWNNTGYELLKVGKVVEAISRLEKSVAARQDLPAFANNLAFAYCEMAENAKGAEARAWAQKALDLLAKYKVEGKLADTKTRAASIIARAK
jgi:hypothetical protein